MTGCEIGHSSYTHRGFPIVPFAIHHLCMSRLRQQLLMQWLWVKLGYLNYWMVFTLGHTHMIFHFNQKKHTHKKKQTNKYVSFPAQVLRIVFELDTLLISVAEYRTSNIDMTEFPVLLMVAAPHYFLMKTSHYLLKRGDICCPKTPKNTRAHSAAFSFQTSISIEKNTI